MYGLHLIRTTRYFVQQVPRENLRVRPLLHPDLCRLRAADALHLAIYYPAVHLSGDKLDKTLGERAPLDIQGSTRRGAANGCLLWKCTQINQLVGGHKCLLDLNVTVRWHYGTEVQAVSCSLDDESKPRKMRGGLGLRLRFEAKAEKHAR